MIDNNIIQSLGAGSGIDTSSLVKQLTALERSTPQSRIDSTREVREAQISDYAIFKNALATLQDAASTLASDEALFSKSAAFTESTALVPSGISTQAQAGIYNIEVLGIAQAQALAFDGLSDPTDTVGEGLLTINFGSWARDNSIPPNATTFSVNGDAESITVEITPENNSLNGLRDAINAKNAGVQASIIFDGSTHRLSLLADSGENNQIEISVADTDGNNSDNEGLSRFSFHSGVTDFSDIETQYGQDANLKVNGLSVYRESNTVDDVVSGLTLDILKAAEGELVTVTITDDKDFAKQSVRDFVTSYNSFLTTMEDSFGFKEVEQADGSVETVAGSLSNDSLTKSILSKVRSVLASEVPGLVNSDYTSLTNVGIRTELDGTISIDETDFDTAFSDHFDDVQKLFGARTVSDSEYITVNSFGSNTMPGQYEISIGSPPSRGLYQGDEENAIDLSGGYDLTAASPERTFMISVNGTQSNTLTLPARNYTDENDIASTLQSLINSDELLDNANDRVLVTYNSDDQRFEIASTGYGTSSTVNIMEASEEVSNELGIVVANGVPGTKVSGSVNGVAGFGSANVLLPALGEAGEGLAMIIGESATTATINYSRGFGGELDALIDEYLKNSGLIDQRESNIQRDLNELDDQETSLDTRMSAFEERLIQQYIAMESIISGLNSSGSFLDSLIDTLPFTSNNN